MKKVAFRATSSVLIAGTLLLCLKSLGFVTGLVLAPLTFWPLLISLSLAWRPTNRGSEIALTTGSVLYFILFLFVYLDAFYWHPDAQSAIALVFVGVYAMPIMLPVWAAYILFERKRRRPLKH